MKKRIIFVIESLSGGGAEKVLSVIVKYFNYEKYEVTICPIVDTGVYCEEIKKCVTHYSPIISYRGNFISQFWNRIKYKLIYSILPLKWVYKWFLPHNNDVEIAFCEGFVTKLLSRANSRAKKIAWVHIDLLYYPWPVELGIYKNFEEEQIAYSVYDEIVCVSKTVEKSFHDKYGLNNTCTIYNPIDIKAIQQHAGIPVRNDGKIMHIISIGRLAHQKGYDRLLEVAKQLHDEGYKFYLTILGEGVERQPLENYIEKNSMTSYVSLPGFCENPYKQLVSSDLFVCSSRAEGFSLVIAEALVLGIPVISTYCSGPNELLNGGKQGLLVENTNEGLYTGLRNFLINKSILPQVNFEEFAHKFDAEKVMEEIYRIL